jgi:hypothetical protein
MNFLCQLWKEPAAVEPDATPVALAPAIFVRLPHMISWRHCRQLGRQTFKAHLQGVYLTGRQYHEISIARFTSFDFFCPRCLLSAAIGFLFEHLQHWSDAHLHNDQYDTASVLIDLQQTLNMFAFSSCMQGTASPSVAILGVPTSAGCTHLRISGWYMRQHRSGWVTLHHQHLFVML